MKKIRVGINGAGRIGRAFMRIAHRRKEIEIVAVNDLADINTIAYLLKYDSAYGVLDREISVTSPQSFQFDGNSIQYLQERDPEKLPWKDLDIDVIVEATGHFTSFEKSQAHINAGAKRVVITAPVKEDQGGATVLMGVNHELLASCKISSNASCTTNAGSPLLKILDQGIGIEKAVLNTVHGYTASQSLVDSPVEKDMRRGRAAAVNIIPSSTGAAIATTKALTSLAGNFDGVALRVPVIAGSIADITFVSKRDTSVEEVNKLLSDAAQGEAWKNIFSVTDEALVSSDILGKPFAAIADLSFTRVVGGNLVKVLSWYDNEAGYTHSLLQHVAEAGKYTA